MQKIIPFLWFDEQAQEAANHYVSIFPNSRIISVSHFGEGAPRPAGSVMTVEFELDGQRMIGLNGGPEYSFTPAISMFVSCRDQREVDRLWERLCDGGTPGRCGWLEDRYGVSWQIIPKSLGDYLGGPDPDGQRRAMEAMLEMSKLDLAALQRAYEGA